MTLPLSSAAMQSSSSSTPSKQVKIADAKGLLHEGRLYGSPSLRAFHLQDVPGRARSPRTPQNSLAQRYDQQASVTQPIRGTPYHHRSNDARTPHNSLVPAAAGGTNSPSRIAQRSLGQTLIRDCFVELLEKKLAIESSRHDLPRERAGWTFSPPLAVQPQNTPASPRSGLRSA